MLSIFFARVALAEQWKTIISSVADWSSAFHDPSVSFVMPGLDAIYTVERDTVKNRFLSRHTCQRIKSRSSVSTERGRVTFENSHRLQKLIPSVTDNSQECENCLLRNERRSKNSDKNVASSKNQVSSQVWHSKIQKLIRSFFYNLPKIVRTGSSRSEEKLKNTQRIESRAMMANLWPMTHAGFSNDPRVDFYKLIIIYITEF